MSIIPDPILALLQVIPFLVLMLGLHLILFKPMLAYLTARDSATAGARRDALHLTETAESRLREYETRLATATSEVADYRTARRAEGMGVYNTKVAAARGEADKRLLGALDGLAADVETARSQIGPQARGLAVAAAAQVLGRPLTQTGEA